nr:Tpr1 [Schizosaccharomyces pombe]
MEGFTLETHASRIIEVPLLGQEDQSVEIDCSSLPSDATELCEILVNEQAPREFWTKFAHEYYIRGLREQAILILKSGLETLKDSESLCILNANIAAIYLSMAREAMLKKDTDLRDEQLRNVRTNLGGANNIDSKSEINVLLHGIYRILLNPTDKESLENAARCFDFVLQKSGGNILGFLGKARILYAKGNYRSAFRLYQRALVSNPQFKPDPRIGIGLCFWNLDMKTDALSAWTRVQQLDPKNTVVDTYIGLYYYDLAFQNVNNDSFVQNYGKALQHIQRAFKTRNNDPVASSILERYVYSKKNYEGCIKLAENVIQNSFSSSLIADGYYWMGRAYHQMGNNEKAMASYQKAKAADDRHLLSSVGIGQIQILQNDLTSAKLTFERIAEQNQSCFEALVVLGCLHASDSKPDLTKARMLLDRAFNLVGSSKLPRVVDSDLYITQARLWEKEDTKKSLGFLTRALDFLESAHMSVGPELLNNIAVLQYHLGLIPEAHGNIIKAKSVLPDANPELSLLLDYNLARCEEELGNTSVASEAYVSILEKHPSFIDARIRKCLLQLSNPNEETFKEIRHIMNADSQNLEVRAFLGWYLSKQKRRPVEDPEVRHCSQTLRHWHDDIYSLVQLGNAYMRQAREFRVHNDREKLKRQKLYIKAIQSYDQAIKFDPKNAHAAQGIAIILAQNRQFSKALLILSKVREAIKDATTLINIGNCLAELKQFSRAIEVFETVYSSTGESDTYGVLSCLGRVWLQRGRESKNVDYLKESVRYATLALEKNPENPSLLFNVAFVQFQLCELIRQKPENSRTVEDLNFAMQQLDASIETFTKLVSVEHPPYSPTSIEQRAKMAKNTTKRQLERAIQAQIEYEKSVAAKLEDARIQREKEKARRLAEEEALLKEKQERERQLQEERQKMQEEVLEWRKSQQKASEDDMSLSDDEEKQSGKKKKKDRKKRKSKSKQESSDSGVSEDDEIPLSDARNKTKKRRVNRRVISEEYTFDQDSDAEGNQEEEVSRTIEEKQDNDITDNQDDNKELNLFSEEDEE